MNNYEIIGDGIDHINIYSKWKTLLGQKLSNFAFTPFKGGNFLFNSVEGWYYFFISGKKHIHLCKLYGYKAKEEGRKYNRVYTVTEKLLYQVYLKKIEYNKDIYKLLKENNLPFTHYYVYGDKIVFPKNDITVPLWNKIKNEIDSGKLK